jgi:hypothetical protein
MLVHELRTLLQSLPGYAKVNIGGPEEHKHLEWIELHIKDNEVHLHGRTEAL